MKPPPGSVVEVCEAVSADPWETVISGNVELSSVNPVVVDGEPVIVRDTGRLVFKLTGNDVVVLNPATVVEFVEFESGAVVVLGAATFCVVVLNPELAVIVIVVAVVILVTRTVLTPVGDTLLLV